MSNTTRVAGALVVLSGLLGTLLLAGCAKGNNVQDIVNKTIDASTKISSFKSEISAALVLLSTGGENPTTLHITTDGTGSIDISGKKSRLLLDLNMLSTTEDQQTMALEVYVADGWQYIKIPMGDAGDKWVKVALTGEWAQTGSHVAQQVALLKNSLQTELVGSEVIDGIDCYVVKVTPDIPTLIRLVLSQTQTQYTIGLAAEDFTAFDLAKVVQSVSLKEWIAKDTYRFKKTEAIVTIQLKPEDTGSPASTFDKIDIQMTMGLGFSDYDVVVTFEVPEEALNAQEASSAGALPEDSSTTDSSEP